MGALSAYSSILNSPPFAIFTVAKYLLVVSIKISGALLYRAAAGIDSNTPQAVDVPADGALFAGAWAAAAGSVAAVSVGVNEQASEAMRNTITAANKVLFFLLWFILHCSLLFLNIILWSLYFGCIFYG